MYLSCTKNKIGYVVQPHSEELSIDMLLKLKDFFKKLPLKTTVAIDLQKVSVISNEFLEFLKECSDVQKISLINLQSEVFVLLNLTKYGQFANIFLTDYDFIKNRNLMLNREFSVV